MPGHSLNVPLHKMSQTADCLAACASMVLEYISVTIVGRTFVTTAVAQGWRLFTVSMQATPRLKSRAATKSRLNPTDLWIAVCFSNGISNPAAKRYGSSRIRGADFVVKARDGDPNVAIA